MRDIPDMDKCNVRYMYIHLALLPLLPYSLRICLFLFHNRSRPDAKRAVFKRLSKRVRIASHFNGLGVHRRTIVQCFYSHSASCQPGGTHVMPPPLPPHHQSAFMAHPHQQLVPHLASPRFEVGGFCGFMGFRLGGII